MIAFLNSVAEHIYRQYKEDLQDVCLVFPNRRASLFFHRHLAQMIERPVWMPPVRTISDLMQELSGFHKGDPLALIFDLYKVYSRERKTTESFSDFYYWGEMLLNDFDDIDKYLVDPKQLFQNLSDLRDIERQFALPEEQIRIIKQFWSNINLDEPGDVKQEFVSVWNVLHKVYQKYNLLLKEKNIVYEGMMYRDVCEKILTGSLPELPFRHFAIIGFNALNACEKEFFKDLRKRGVAEFFWDYDEYYVSNTWHEAGLFMRENLSMFPHPEGFQVHSSLTSPKNLNVISVPSDVGQAKMIPYILETWHASEKDLSKTAVVLSDEQLLIPVLTSLPGYVSDVNVTLGYPLNFTPVYSFYEAITAMHQNARTTGGVLKFYHRDVSALLNHPYVQTICPAEANELLKYMVLYNRVFLDAKELSKHSFLEQLFTIHKNARQFLSYLTETGSRTAYLLAPEGEEPDFNREYWLTFITSLNRLADIIDTEGLELELPVLNRIIRKIMNGISIPFRGEPLKGLQLMGMLETRALDFENVILLSANEGQLPKGDSALSFIPYNLRRGFGLPTIEQQDAMYAYYFYRMIQRAENVALVYNSQGNNGKGGEMSRFLYQLKYEQPFGVKVFNQSFRVSLAGENDITIAKSPDVMQRLLQYTGEDAKYLTPTAINAYLECSLRFYFRYILLIREKEDISEDIEGSMFGKLLHHAMETVYKPYLQKSMTFGDFKNILSDPATIENSILDAFAAEYFKKPNETPHLHGKSLVVKEILRKYISRIVEFDRQLSPLIPLSFEKTFRTIINIDNLKVNVGGKIDRIDSANGAVRVLDYKTGKVDYKFESVGRLFEIGGKKQNKEVLQILFYAYLLSEHVDFRDYQIIPGLYGMRDIFKKDFDYRIQQGRGERMDHFYTVRQPYLEGLKSLLAEIFDPLTSFEKSADKKNCEYCSFSEICHR